MKKTDSRAFIFLSIVGIGVAGLWAAYIYMDSYSTFETIGNVDVLSLGLFVAIPLFALLNINYFKTELGHKPLLRRGLWLLTIALAVAVPTRNLLNIAFDYSALQEIIVKVDEKSTFHGRRAHYKLIVESSVLGPGLRDFEVEKTLYDEVKTGEKLALQVHPGALGLLWFSGIWKKVALIQKEEVA